MKDIAKVSLLSAIGFAVALFIYPCLHEGGHAAATVLLGGRCVDFQLFPVPYMICNATGLGTAELVVIGVSGTLLPLIVSVAMRGKSFYLWYIRLLLRGITVLSLFLSFVVVTLRRLGIIAPNDDVTEILRLWHNGSKWIAMGSLFLCVFIIILIAQEKPIKRIIASLPDNVHKQTQPLTQEN